MMLCSRDTVHEILRRVDGTTLAMVSSTCKDFDSVSKDESLWEKACQSLWPSIWMDESLKSYVSSSSFGGFRKLYSHCYPCSSSLTDSHEDVGEVKFGDFIWAIDVRYGEESVTSKVIHGQQMCPLSDQNEGMLSWFLHSPFGVSVTNDFYDSGVEEKQSHEKLFKNVLMELQRKKETIRKMMKVSWIVIDQKDGRAANLSTPGWNPFDVNSDNSRCYCELSSNGKNNNFIVRFGSVIGTHDNRPLKKHVRCVAEVYCKLGDERVIEIQVTELGFHFEYLGGRHLSGIESLQLMKRIVKCCTRTTKVGHALGLQNEMVRLHDMTIHGKESRKQAMEGVASLMSVMLLLGFWVLVFSKFIIPFLRQIHRIVR